MTMSLDMKGNEIIPCEHSHLSACSDGMFLYGATAEDGWSTVYGFLDKKGNVVVKFRIYNKSIRFFIRILFYECSQCD